MITISVSKQHAAGATTSLEVTVISLLPNQDPFGNPFHRTGAKKLPILKNPNSFHFGGWSLNRRSAARILLYSLSSKQTKRSSATLYPSYINDLWDGIYSISPQNIRSFHSPFSNTLQTPLIILLLIFLHYVV